MAVFATGKVEVIGAIWSGASIRLSGLPADQTPKGGDPVFLLDRNHANYNALYSMALVAATNGRDLRIRVALVENEDGVEEDIPIVEQSQPKVGQLYMNLS